uniref:Uncharacterized protein n=1 Tax=Anguilla anguilla TaxID=7936 RepID=A0A0E9P899_ANGAN
MIHSFFFCLLFFNCWISFV